MEKDQIILEKPKRKCGFFKVKDKNYMTLIREITGVSEDMTDVFFWCPAETPANWGLTLKSNPKDPTDYFSSQHIWKYTWIYKDGLLRPSVRCKKSAKELSPEESAKLEAIALNYMT